MKLGKAKYGYTKKKYWKLKDGESIYRILPPMGDLADDGKWSAFWNVHYGYKNSKGQMRTFESPLVVNRKTKMVEKPDAALERINALKAQWEEAKKSGNAELAAKLNELVGPKAKFNLDKNHYVNAMDLQGNIGILKLRHRAMKALEATIKRLVESGVNPLDEDNGRFFVFRRSGTGLDTSFQVDIHMEKLNVPNVGEVSREVVHALTPEIIRRFKAEAAELDKLYPRPTPEEVARIVKEGAPAVDEILDTKETADISTGEEETLDSNEAAAPVQAAAPAATVTPAATVVSTAVAPTQAAPVQAAPVAETPAPVQQAVTPTPVTPVAAAPAPTPAPVATPASAPATTAKAVGEQTDEEFLKSLGL